MNTKTLIDQVIPPEDYTHRNGFDNIPIVSKLSEFQKQNLENMLIEKLFFNGAQHIDTLIVETLGYLKSKKSLVILKKLLDVSPNELTRLTIAYSIFEIDNNQDMISIAINILQKIEKNRDAYFVQKLTSAFYLLIKFHNKEIDSIIFSYVNHEEYLIRYNAKQVLGIKMDVR